MNDLYIHGVSVSHDQKFSYTSEEDRLYKYMYGDTYIEQRSEFHQSMPL